MKMTIITYIVTLLMTFYITKPLICQNQSDIQNSIPAGKARIIFIKKNVLYRIKLILIDRGTGINFNTRILQKKVFTEESKSHNKSENVTLLIIKDTASTLIRNNKTIDLGTLYNTPQYWSTQLYSAKMPFSNGNDSILKILIPVNYFFHESRGQYSYHVVCPSAELPKGVKQLDLKTLWTMQPNALTIIEDVERGQIVTWDRSPGLMRLEAITYGHKRTDIGSPSGGGTQSFAPPFQIEAGKTYWVYCSFPMFGGEIEIYDKKREDLEQEVKSEKNDENY